MFKRIVFCFTALLLVCLTTACSKEPMSKQNLPQQAGAIMPKNVVEQPVKTATNVPVLMYHSIAEEKGNDAVISQELFTKQIEYLHQHNYYTASLDELYDHLTGKKALPEKSVVLTFDDGYLDTYTIAMPLLKRYGFKSTVFVPAADIGKNLTAAQLKEMKQAGMEVVSHSNNHRDLSPLSYEQQMKEITESKEKLDALLTQDTKYFCYPNGSYNDTTLQILNQKGFKMAFTINPGWVKPQDNLLLLKRVWMGNSVTLQYFEERLTKENYSII